MASLYGLACPLTKRLMRNPVVASDGYTYERAAIERWMASSGARSPITGAPLPTQVTFELYLVSTGITP
jgi:hypothetical protein